MYFSLLLRRARRSCTVAGRAATRRRARGTFPALTITTTTDLVVRVVAYVDVWGQTNTSTFDAVTGRLITNVGPTGSSGYTYDRAGRVTQQTLDGVVIAIPTYATPGSANEHTLASISYPSGAGSGGNGTTGTFSRNSNGAVTQVVWTGPGGTTITSDQVTRSQTGRVIDPIAESASWSTAHAERWMGYLQLAHMRASSGATSSNDPTGSL